MISLSKFFLVVKRYKDRFFGEINGLIGNEAAAQIQEVIKNTALSGKTTFSYCG
jgi:membrane protein